MFWRDISCLLSHRTIGAAARVPSSRSMRGQTRPCRWQEGRSFTGVASSGWPLLSRPTASAWSTGMWVSRSVQPDLFCCSFRPHWHSHLDEEGCFRMKSKPAMRLFDSVGGDFCVFSGWISSWKRAGDLAKESASVETRFWKAIVVPSRQLVVSDYL